MAKRRAKSLTSEANSAQYIPVDTLFGDVQADVAAKNVKRGVPVSSVPLYHVLPVPALSFRMLLKNEGLPLGFFFVLAGIPASYKSTLALEMGAWHAKQGGLVAIAETEAKANSDVQQGIYDWKPNQLQTTVCHSLEDWQTVAINYVATVQKKMKSAGGGGKSWPFMMMVDSISGRLSRKVAEDLLKTGHGVRRFSLEAKLNTDFLKCVGAEMIGWPFNFIAVNHLKTGTDPTTGLPTITLPGGEQAKFSNVLTLALGISRGIEQFADYKAALVSIRLEKNSYGPGGGQMQVRFRTWYEDDANGDPKLKCKFEWEEASILMLHSGFGLRKREAEYIKPRVDEVCDMHEKSGGSTGKLFWSNRLGVPSSEAMKARDLGALLETRPDVLADLYKALEIPRRPFFQPGVDYQEQIDAYTELHETAPLPSIPPVMMADDDSFADEGE